MKQKVNQTLQLTVKSLRMVQAVDGNWYGYFADQTSSTLLQTLSQQVDASIGGQKDLDFGTFCATSDETSLGS